MGSGQGKARRAQVVSIGARPTLPSLEKWRSFVEQNHLKNVTLGSYYLGGFFGPADAREFELIAKEMCQDAVSLGAIILPQGMKIEDLNFKLENNPRTNYPNLCLVIEDQRTKKKGTSDVAPSYYLRPANKLGDGRTRYALREISAVIQDAT